MKTAVGYVPVEQRQKEKLSVGEIAIDGIFTPIKNVNFTVENIRVGQRTDYNKVLMDIETDGSISPEEALKKASQILIDHFTDYQFNCGSGNVQAGGSQTEKAKKERKKKKRKRRSSSLTIMEHGKKIRKFGRETKQRKELMRDLAEALITHGKITTTQAKAKSLRPYVEKVITKSKANSVATARFLACQIQPWVVKKLLQEIGPKFASRNGGYTRIINLSRRTSDGAKMAIIEFVSTSNIQIKMTAHY